MSEDPRLRNQVYDLHTIEGHVKGYVDALSKALLSVDYQQLNLAIAEIEGARVSGARLWVAGNGGSAAIADHLLCDWVKGTYTRERPPIHVHSLVANTALLTAVANDFSYEVGFSRQLEMQAKPGDVLICISSSGNSPNILAAMRQADVMNMKTIAFSGFSGGEASKLADISVHVDAHN